MTIQINKEKLLNGLQKTVRVIPSRSTLPILACAYFEFHENTLIIKATNLETSISISVEYDGEKPEKPIALPINRLLEIVNNINDHNIELLIEEKKLTINTKNGKFSISGFDPNEFPAEPVMNEAVSVSIKMETLQKIIGFTKNSTSKDELKPALQGVLLKIDQNRIMGVSTDGHRLSRIAIEHLGNQEKEFEIIVPTKFLTILAETIEKGEQVEIDISNNYMSLSYKNISLISKIIKDTYPDYEKVIPLDNDKSISINKKDLKDAIKRVSIFSNRSTKQITIEAQKTELTVMSEDADNAAKGKERIACTYSGEEGFKIGFNSSFLLESIACLKKTDMHIFLKNPLGATIITEKEEAQKTDKLILLMPIRLNDN